MKISCIFWQLLFLTQDMLEKQKYYEQYMNKFSLSDFSIFDSEKLAKDYLDFQFMSASTQSTFYIKLLFCRLSCIMSLTLITSYYA